MSTQNNQQLTDEVKRKAIEYGADVVGIAPLERFENNLNEEVIICLRAIKN